MKKSVLIIGLLIAVLLPAVNLSAQDEKHLIVLVKYKVQPAKEIQAVTALKELIEQVKKEPNFVKIKIHVDPVDRTNILLYEEWTSEKYYKGDHMQTPHLQKFMIDSRDYLTGPPEISFWIIQD
jgi:quinol monooxygenase YgiN